MKTALVLVLMLTLVASAMATEVEYKDKSCVYTHTHGGWENVCTDKTRELDIGDALKGEKGDKGDKGEQGIQGIQGIQGEKGEDGVDGKDGLNGINGKDGEDGEDGSDATVDLTPIEDRLVTVENKYDRHGISRQTVWKILETEFLNILNNMFVKITTYEQNRINQQELDREQNKRIFACEQALGMTEGY